ncbi:MAG: type II secretion system protein [Candidatus Gastranaerophilales bacterium]
MLKKINGFTLAEVLITLGIIGVVSAMTMPNLVSNYQNEALAKKKLLFEGRLEEAMNQMRFHEKLANYSTVDKFVEELGNYLKIDYTCDDTDMEECFPDTIINSCGNNKTLDDLKTGNDFAAATSETDYSQNNVGVVFADGTKALINYNMNCSWLDPYDGGANRSEAVQCVAMLADVSGNRGKNTVNNDILPINTNVGVNVSGTCWDVSDTLFSAINTCDSSGVNAQYDSTGTNNTHCASNYLAGAIKACNDLGKTLPTSTKHSSLASYLYEGAYTEGENVWYATPIEENFAELGFTRPTALWTNSISSLSTDSYGYAFVMYDNKYMWQHTSYSKGSSVPITRCITD